MYIYMCGGGLVVVDLLLNNPQRLIYHKTLTSQEQVLGE